MIVILYTIVLATLLGGCTSTEWTPIEPEEIVYTWTVEREMLEMELDFIRAVSEYMRK